MRGFKLFHEFEQLYFTVYIGRFVLFGYYKVLFKSLWGVPSTKGLREYKVLAVSRNGISKRKQV